LESKIIDVRGSFYPVEMSDFKAKLNTALCEAGLDIGEEKLCKLVRYFEMLIEKNKVMNLTAITEEDEFITKHFLDSLSLVKFTETGKSIAEGTSLKVIDVGTGAGFPGVVLKIVYPQLEMTLFDSLNKRLLFLEEVIGELGLTGVVTKHGRAEDLGHDKAHREKYDLVLARAVANLSTLSEYCLPLTKIHGQFIAYKSSELEEELKTAGRAIGLLGGKPEEKVSFVLPGTDFTRAFAVIRKAKETPGKYPRKAGTPAKEPLV